MKGLTWPNAIEERRFAGFPGTYGPGVVVPLEELGMSEDEARKRIKAQHLPLKVVTIKEQQASPASRAEAQDEEPATPSEEGEQ